MRAGVGMLSAGGIKMVSAIDLGERYRRKSELSRQFAAVFSNGRRYLRFAGEIYEVLEGERASLLASEPAIFLCQ